MHIILPHYFPNFILNFRKEGMDIRSSRRCGTVCKLLDPALLWETCLQTCGKDSSFSIGCECVFHRHKRQFPHFHDAICYPRMSRYAVSGTYHTATISRHTRTKPPITPPIIKLKINSAILPPKERPPGMIQRHIRWSPKGRPQSIYSHT